MLSYRCSLVFSALCQLVLLSYAYLVYGKCQRNVSCVCEPEQLLDVGLSEVIAFWLFYRNAHRIGQELEG